jgi:hypothetical protein
MYVCVRACARSISFRVAMNIHVMVFWFMKSVLCYVGTRLHAVIYQHTNIYIYSYITIL